MLDSWIIFLLSSSAKMWWDSPADAHNVTLKTAKMMNHGHSQRYWTVISWIQLTSIFKQGYHRLAIDVLQSSGKLLSLNNFWKIHVNWNASKSAQCFNKCGCILSGPGDIEALRMHSFLCTTCSANNAKAFSSSNGLDTRFTRSAYTFWNWSLRNCAFCRSQISCPLHY